MIERPAVLEVMVKLKLRGMRAAYDEVITLAAKRHHSPEQVVGQLLALQLADVESRATAYRMGNARFPVMRMLAEFDLAGSPVNANAVRELHKGAFLGDHRNVVLIGGTGSGKTHGGAAQGVAGHRHPLRKDRLKLHGRPLPRRRHRLAQMTKCPSITVAF